MTTPLREQLLRRLPQVAVSGASLPAPLERQLGEDEGLREWWQRQLEITRALTRLPRLEVPDDLAGRVVGATQSGHRQQRAADYLASLAPHPATEALDLAVRRSAELPFRDAGHSAPAALDERVALEFDGLPSTVAGVQDEVVGRRPGAVLAAALAVVALVGVGSWLRSGVVHAAADEPAPVSFANITLFEVVPVSAEEAPALGAELDGLTGGALAGGLR